MANSIRGEILARLDDKDWTLCLTLGALAELETNLGAENLSALAAKFSKGSLSARELLKVIHAGFLGGGYQVCEQEVAEMRVEGGINGYADIVARLLSATFTPIQDGTARE